MAGHQNAIYPWRAYPNEFPDCTQSDQADLSYPWQSFASRSFRSGEVPFWNPYSFGGEPFLANGSAGVVYPPHLIAAFLVGAGWAHDLFSIFHVFMAGLAMYLLVREFGSGPGGGLLSGVTWMFSGFNLGWLHLEVVAPVFVFLPLTLLGVRRAARLESWRSTVVAASFIAFGLIAGHLPFMGVTCLVAVVYAAFLAAIAAARSVSRGDWRAAGLPIGRAIAVGVLPVFIAAVVLVPTFLNVRSSQRDLPSYEAQHTAIRVPATLFLNVLSPPVGPPDEMALHGLAFISLAALPFVLLGAAQRRAGVGLALSLGVTILLVATDTPALRLAYLLIPSFGTFRPLGRLLFLFNFSLALLAGFGLDALHRWLLGSEPHPHESAAAGQVRATALTVVVVAICAIELIHYGRTLNPPFPPRRDEFLFPETPFIKAARRAAAGGTGGPGRVLPLQRTPIEAHWYPPVLFAAESMIFGIESAGGYDSVVPRRSLALWQVAAGEPATHVLANPATVTYVSSFTVRDTRIDLLPRLGITVLVAPPDADQDPFWKAQSALLPLKAVYGGPDGLVFRIGDAAAGPYVVHQAVSARSESDAFLRFVEPSFDYRQAVILEGEVPPSALTESPGPQKPARILRYTKKLNRLVAHVTTEQSGWLVVPDTWSPGWRAKVNGESVPLLRADFAFRAVAIPPGESEVRMSYHPEGLVEGAVISGGTVLTMIVLTLAGRTRRRRAAQPV